MVLAPVISYAIPAAMVGGAFDLSDITNDFSGFLSFLFLLFNPYLGLAAACWVGAGGVLVPVPGVRPLSWVMVVHQSVALDPLVVTGLSALAMAFGQTSLFIAAEYGADTIGRTRNANTVMS